MKSHLFHSILPLTQIAHKHHLAAWFLHQNSPQKEIIKLQKNPFYFTRHMLIQASVPENPRKCSTIHKWKSLCTIYILTVTYLCILNSTGMEVQKRSFAFKNLTLCKIGIKCARSPLPCFTVPMPRWRTHHRWGPFRKLRLTLPQLDVCIPASEITRPNPALPCPSPLVRGMVQSHNRCIPDPH